MTRESTPRVETLVIGAGPAGLSCAAQLTRQGRPPVVIERDPRVGGLSKTYEFHEGDGAVFRTDNGPHRFFSKNQDLYRFIEGLLGEDWIPVRRQTRQFIEGKFYEYPVVPLQALRNMGLWRALRVVADYAVARVRYGLLRKPIISFEDYIVSKFGRALGDFNMINYTEKLWGVPASTIHPDWGTQRIAGLSLSSVVRDVAKRYLRRRADGPKSLVSQFYYPSRGTGLIYEAISAEVRGRGATIHLGAAVKKVRTENSRVAEVEVQLADGQRVTYRPEHLVESVPVVKFLALLDPAPPAEVQNAASHLRYRSQVYVFLTLDRESVTADQWIYFPDKAVPFARVSEMRNFSAEMSPAGKTSLFVEYFCFEDDEVWRASDESLVEKTMAELVRLGFVKPDELRHGYVVRLADVYPIYDLEYARYLDAVKSFLDGIENLHYIGRPGRFRYNNQDHSIEMGLAAAEGVLRGEKPDFDAIGGEKEYYEKGSNPKAQ